MELTRSISSERDRALLGGDYDAYHAQASRRIRTLRRRLGTATPKGRKYSPKERVTAANIAQNVEWVQLLLASAERAWADAMAMKASQSQETTQKPMPGSTKRQIASRLRRAILYASNLVSALEEDSASNISRHNLLEAKAYLYMLKGSLNFERANWESCIKNYSVTRAVYETLGTTAKTDLYRDLLSGIVEPSMRYAAYQLKMPRTKPVKDIVVENFPAEEKDTKDQLLKIESRAFQTTKEASEGQAGVKDVPSHISWRNRSVKLEDANIAQALGVAHEKENALQTQYSSNSESGLSASNLASLYDDVITARQDAADATKAAIDELSGEGVDAGDSRMQSLQITRTAVNYAVIEWRVGRNRVLCGPEDGVAPETSQTQSSKASKSAHVKSSKMESHGRKLARLRERTALYDSILQSLDSVKELPGVIADSSLISDLDSKYSYFRALKCVSIGQSYVISGEVVNALALFSRAHGLVDSVPESAAVEKDISPSKLNISSSQLSNTKSYLSNLVTQYRALAELQSLSSPTTNAEKNEKVYRRPLIETLHLNQYSDNVDLKNLVNYPPKLQPIPVKPLFFDLAWNYIHYPGHGHVSQLTKAPVSNGPISSEEEKKEEPRKRGWFGFGR